jgi:2-C-methyl-D-erythritol 4-phosphate cytidylyltransferase
LPPDAGVVLVAAGRGVRAGGGVPKQLRPVGGVPLVLRALAPFQSHPSVAHIALVLPAATVSAPPQWLDDVSRDTRVTLVTGGAERADSVRAGLAALPPVCTVVLVHDAARPFVDRALIDRVLDAARTGDGAVPAIAESDTLKQADGDPPVVRRTIPRDGLWRAQTPQGFPRAAIEAAHRAADGSAATDDAYLAEQAGLRVRLVAGSPYNIKVTTADDFAIAELFASRAGA